MAEKPKAEKTIVKLQLQAGKATAGPPVGSTLGPHGINLPAFVKEFNEKTADKAGFIIPVVVTINADRSFSFVLKTPPAAVLILKTLGIEKGSAKPNKQKVGTMTRAQAEAIAKEKMPDLTAASLDAAVNEIVGAAKSMGIKLEG